MKKYNKLHEGNSAPYARRGRGGYRGRGYQGRGGYNAGPSYQTSAQYSQPPPAVVYNYPPPSAAAGAPPSSSVNSAYSFKELIIKSDT